MASTSEIKALEELLQKVAEQFQQQLESIRDELNQISISNKPMLPQEFDRDRIISFLRDPNGLDLDAGFVWSSSPQGYAYWERISCSPEDLPLDATVILQDWVIKSFIKEFGHGTDAQ